jgi:hypothetical protein
VAGGFATPGTLLEVAAPLARTVVSTCAMPHWPMVMVVRAITLGPTTMCPAMAL